MQICRIREMKSKGNLHRLHWVIKFATKIYLEEGSNPRTAEDVSQFLYITEVIGNLEMSSVQPLL